MIKCRASRGKKILIGFGLSEENIKRLKAGQPILFDAEELGIENTEITILYGQTEEKMYKDLRDAGLIKL